MNRNAIEETDKTVHGSERVRAAEGLRGNEGAWWRHAVIYQIYPRSFFDSTGNGTGDLPGIARKMDYIHSLGVDAIWISPFFKSPMKDFGYDVSDYRAVDPLFGSLDDFDVLLEAAHGRGLRVIIDQVMSHTSDQHPWFLESRDGRDNDKADWYVWADARPDGGPPNNWLAVFGGSAWEWEPRRRQYYLHNFLASQPDLNCRNPEVRRAGLDNLEFWLERGVDGIRLDAVNFCMHDPELRDNPAKPAVENEFLGSGQAQTPYAMQEHFYDHTHPDNLRYMEDIRALLDQYEAVALGEVGSERSLNVIGEYTRGDHRLHMAYSFDLMGPDGSASHIKRTMDAIASEVRDGWCCLAIGNHDVQRVASRWTGDRPDPDAAKLFSILLCCLRGAVCLYQGDELGLPEADVPYEQLKDPYGINFWPAYKGRDGCRTPMPWQAEAANAGFTNATPWLPVDACHFDLAVDRQQGDPGSVYECVRAFLHFRKHQPALLHGGLEFLPLKHNVLSFVRSTTEQTLFMSFNLDGAERLIPFEALAFDGSRLSAVGDPAARQGRIGGDSLVLPGHSVLIAEFR
ncbi:MAG: alpha-amylase family glycosyl hydrolase [Gammaproteobacteria bacterium]|nr:alpha-amylase family glycosyl hydrolase [Gammaproteobacteria bacterium]